MRKLTYRNGRDQFWRGASSARFQFVCLTDGHIGKFAVAIVCEVQVIRDRPNIQHRLLFERGLRAADLHFVNVLQHDPDFVVFRSNGDVR